MLTKYLDHEAHNCNLPGDGVFSQVRMWKEGKLFDYKKDCNKRMKYAVENGVNFMGMESPYMMPREMFPCSNHFITVTVMRDPMDRIVSNMRIHKNTEADVRRWLTKDAITGHVTSTGTNAYNNYYTRILLGHGMDKNFIPLDTVNRTHLEIAKGLLAKFDFVIPLHQMCTEPVKRWFVDHVGWDETAINTQWRGMQHSGNPKHNLEKKQYYDDIWTRTDFIDLIQKHNRLDAELYRFALDLFEKQKKEYGLDQMSTDGLCHNLSISPDPLDSDEDRKKLIASNKEKRALGS